ncbi:MAG: DUF4296 domain-containing protein [Prevotella sp.]
MKRVCTVLLVLLSLLMVACKPSIPDEYLSPDDMEDLLYDIYVSKAMAEQDAKDGNMGYNRRLYFLAVLKKHGLTEAEFDSSMVYYHSRADYMRKIYSSLQDRIGVKTTGSAATELRQRFVLGGDTADIWHEKRAYMLTPMIPYNRVDFIVKADTSFRKGDTYMISFDTNFIYQNGSKDGVVYIAVRYDNDSIASFSRNISSSGLMQLRVTPNDDAKVRDLRGFIYLDRGRDETSTLKMMFLDNIQLLRLRKQKPKEESGNSVAKNDSTTAKDTATIHRADSVRSLHNRQPLRPLPEGGTPQPPLPR